LAIVHPARCNQRDLTTGEGTDLASEKLCHGGDQDNGRDVASVASSLAPLRADKIRSDFNSFESVLRVSDHVHVEDAALVQTVGCPFRGDTNGADEQFGAAFDDDLDKLAELPVGVVIADGLAINPLTI
jgi:hypothetical protein